MRYYLRMEGVNLSNFVYDTNDLNTVRGGSLLLLHAIDMVSEMMPDILHPISTGASSGLFRFEAESDAHAEKIRKDVEALLNVNPNSAPFFKHATFVVDWRRASGGENAFSHDKEKLIALNRWRQMQSLSIVVPEESADTVCEIDMVRPAAVRLEKYKNNINVPVSKATLARRKYGLEQKQEFYKTITEIPDLPKFTHELDELTSDADNFLHHKMAVIYIDGNSFGKIQSKLNSTALKDWDDALKNYRKSMLTELLNATRTKKPWTNGAKHRMETLLWGGDELLWVVPAWVGWWTLKFFYDKSKDWAFKGDKLKHAAGIVFCHHNAPIHRVKKLAQSLAELAKKKRDKNLFAYQVLETFDHTGDDLMKYRRGLCPPGADLQSLLLSAEDMSTISDCLDVLKNEFPRTKLHRIVKAFFAGNNAETEKLIKSVIGREDMDNSSGQKVTAEAIKSLEGVLNGEVMKWVHIADLWDYALNMGGE